MQKIFIGNERWYFILDCTATIRYVIRSGPKLLNRLRKMRKTRFLYTFQARMMSTVKKTAEFKKFNNFYNVLDDD